MSDNPFSKIPDRARVQVNAIPIFKIPELPRIPESHLKKFPELRQLSAQQEEWIKELNSVLTNLSSRLKLDPKLSELERRIQTLENQ